MNLAVDSFVWNAVFCVINIVQASIVLHSERPVRLNHLEEEIFLRVFKSKRIPLSRRDFKLLARKGVILDYHDGEVYLKKNAAVETVALVLDGQIFAYDTLDEDKSPSPPDFAKINVSGPWEWADSPQFIFNVGNADNPEPAAITLVSNGSTRLCVWTLDDLRTLCAENAQISVCFLSVLSKDCACKVLKTKNYLLSTDLIREAARASYSENARLQRVTSIDMPHDSPKVRLNKNTEYSPIPLSKSNTATLLSLDEKQRAAMASTSRKTADAELGDTNTELSHPSHQDSEGEPKSKNSKQRKKKAHVTEDTTFETAEHVAKGSKSRSDKAGSSTAPNLPRSSSTVQGEDEGGSYELREMTAVEKIATSGISVSSVDEELTPIPESTTSNVNTGSPVISEEEDDEEARLQ